MPRALALCAEAKMCLATGYLKVFEKVEAVWDFPLLQAQMCSLHPYFSSH